MARPPVLDLLRPPAHRGPLIASGAVVLAAGLALEELRLNASVGNGFHLVFLALAAGLVLGLGLQAPVEEDGPPAYQSVVLVTGLLLLYAALLTLAEVLGADFGADFPGGAFTWTSLVLAVVALWAAMFLRSSICMLIAAIAVGIAVLSALNWILGADSQGPYRAALLLLALAMTLGSLALRSERPRHAAQLVNAAGLAILAIPLVALAGAAVAIIGIFGGSPGTLLPSFWELVVLAAACGLIAYGAVDRAPGAAYLGSANLVAFIAVTGLVSDETLRWWPLILLALGGAAMVAGLRPRAPLPPEPDAYRAGEQPLAARTGEEEIRLRVRDDSPPRSI
jgi:hypothetical protein